MQPNGSRGLKKKRDEGRQKREQARALHRDWDVLTRFLIIGVIIYIIPSVAEVVIASLWWCGDGSRVIPIWMLADAFLSLVSVTTLSYWTYSMHSGIANDEDLKGYLYDREIGDNREEFERLDLKYQLLRRKSRLCPECFHIVPYVSVFVGFGLWYATRDDQRGECDIPDGIVLGIVLTKIIIPALLGMCYGCVFLFIAFCREEDPDAALQDGMNRRNIELTGSQGTGDWDGDWDEEEARSFQKQPLAQTEV